MSALFLSPRGWDPVVCTSCGRPYDDHYWGDDPGCQQWEREMGSALAEAEDEIAAEREVEWAHTADVAERMDHTESGRT